MKLVGTCALLLLLVSQIGCDSNPATDASSRDRNSFCDPGVRATGDGVIEICSALNAQMQRSFQSLLTSTTRRVIISSPGGSPSEAAELSRILDERGIAVTLRGICLLACAPRGSCCRE